MCYYIKLIRGYFRNFTEYLFLEKLVWNPAYKIAN